MNFNENLLSTPLAVQANAGMIMTQPGDLKCKKIIHIVGQSDPVKINKVVKEALRMCVTNSFTSVSFPAIGTGELLQPNGVIFFIICEDYFYAQTYLSSWALSHKKNPEVPVTANVWLNLSFFYHLGLN